MLSGLYAILWWFSAYIGLDVEIITVTNQSQIDKEKTRSTTAWLKDRWVGSTAAHVKLTHTDGSSFTGFSGYNQLFPTEKTWNDVCHTRPQTNQLLLLTALHN